MKCPLCGTKGWEGIFSFKCDNVTCKNGVVSPGAAPLEIWLMDEETLKSWKAWYGRFVTEHWLRADMLAVYQVNSRGEFRMAYGGERFGPWINWTHERVRDFIQTHLPFDPAQVPPREKAA